MWNLKLCINCSPGNRGEDSSEWIPCLPSLWPDSTKSEWSCLLSALVQRRRRRTNLQVHRCTFWLAPYQLNLSSVMTPDTGLGILEKDGAMIISSEQELTSSSVLALRNYESRILKKLKLDSTDVGLTLNRRQHEIH